MTGPDDDLPSARADGPMLRSVERFDVLYERHYRALVGLAYVLTGSHHTAEDLVQHAFTDAHRQWERLSTHDNPGAWLRRVVVNKSHSRFRRLGAEARALARIGHRREPEFEPSPQSTEVWAAVRRLPHRQAAAIALKYWEDLSIAEVAAVLDCSTETVKTHLTRARATLGRELEDSEGSR